MNDQIALRRWRWIVSLLVLTFVWGCSEQSETERMSRVANPCAAAANPCAGTSTNPCAVTNPCAAANPCAGARAQVDPNRVTRPEGTEPYRAARAELIAQGGELWKDTNLSTNGLSCNTCHMNNLAFLATFAEPYPHKVEMALVQANLGEVQIDEMVQLCMVVPMQSEALPWESKELAALAAYSTDVAQKGYVTAYAANPCMARMSMNPCNPCAGKMNPCNPCNPCAGKMNPCNPCAAANPGMGKANPCNPCNPCAVKNPCAR